MSNIAVDGESLASLFDASNRTDPLDYAAAAGANRKKLASTEPKLVQSLVALMDSPSLKVQCQAALALRNLASDGGLTRAFCPLSDATELSLIV